MTLPEVPQNSTQPDGSVTNPRTEGVAPMPTNTACKHPRWRLLDDGDFECHDCGEIEGDDDDES